MDEKMKSVIAWIGVFVSADMSPGGKYHTTRNVLDAEHIDAQIYVYQTSITLIVARPDAAPFEADEARYIIPLW